MEALYASTQQKLGITSDEFNSLFTACPVGGAAGAAVAQSIRERFNVPAAEPDLARYLRERGVITDAEERILNDDSEENVAEAYLDADPQMQTILAERPAEADYPDGGDLADAYSDWSQRVMVRGGELLREGGFSDRLSVAVDYIGAKTLSVLELS